MKIYLTYTTYSAIWQGNTRKPNQSCGLFLPMSMLPRTAQSAPVDRVMHTGNVHNIAVVGGTAGVFAGFDHQRTGLAELTLAAGDCALSEFGGRKIAVDSGGLEDAHCLKIRFHFSMLLSAFDYDIVMRKKSQVSANNKIMPFSGMIAYYLRINRIPRVLGPQWLATVQPAVVGITSSK